MNEKSAKKDTENKPPFRYDIVGSFLRPAELAEAREKHRNGELTDDELKAVEDREIIKLVEKQKEIGLKAVTDGEFRRSWWHLDFMWGLDGVEKVELDHGYNFVGVKTRAETARLTGKIDFSDHPFLQHYRFLKEAAGDDVLARQSIPAPAQFLSELQRAENAESTNRIYPDIHDLVEDIAAAYRKAIRAFYELGCRSFQFDDCTWGMMCDKDYMKKKLGDGYDRGEMESLYLDLNNKALEGHPEDMTITTHVCRGNFRSTWASSGGYEPVAEPLLGKEEVDAYYLEFDTERAGDFTPLRHLRGNKKVVLGLVSSKTGELEERDKIIERIKEASRFVPLDRLHLSPQCGFASTEEGNILSEEEQWNKLKFIREIAQEVWKEE